ncbi:tRNA pseudouridine(55) synthase TruB [Chloroflexi bacterium TSY]|nr:tRNA pseudouridine(55) synthase TruB [Chloroflexi bacterium TSY]
MAKREEQYHGLLIVDKPGRVAVDSSLNSSLDSTEKTTTGLKASANRSQTFASDLAPRRESSSPLSPNSSERNLPTSHDIVQMVRRWSQQRRIGHTGTLDPMASGVLVLCLGKATRLVEYYQGHAKQYYAEIVLGKATDTYDAVGTVTEQITTPRLNSEQLDAALSKFRGHVWQIPPLYSALKRDGESLHRKARRGETVTLDPCSVFFHELDLLRYDPPDSKSGGRLYLRTVCSAGTYIRSLAHDLGQALGTVAYLDILRREAAGSFNLEQARSLDDLEQASEDNRFGELLLPLGSGLHLPKITLDEHATQRLGYGQTIILNSPETLSVAQSLLKSTPEQAETLSSAEDTQLAAAIQQGQVFVGIIRCLGYTDPSKSGPGTMWKAEKWFA